MSANDPTIDARKGRYLRKKFQLADAVKAVPCADCGIQYPAYVMDFDHVRGDKLSAVSVLVNSHSLQSVIDEIAKCDVVCSNCHRERTHQRSIGVL